MYKENDYVMYKHDICKVREIRRNHLNGNDYYILVPLSDESLVMSVPVENRLNYIKPIMTKDEANDLIENIKDIKPLNNINDKNIENTYKELINSCDRNDLIKIIKTSFLRNKERIDNKKKIGEKDKNYFDKAECYLYNELAISLSMSYDEVKEYIINKMSSL